MCQIRQRVTQLLSIRGGSIKAIKSIMRGKIASCLQKVYINYYIAETRRVYFLHAVKEDVFTER